LDIAARTVVAHGGIISVDEAPGGGAVFTMEFDALSAQDSTVNFPIREASSGARSHLRL
jgi:hypothetical protein